VYAHYFKPITTISTNCHHSAIRNVPYAGNVRKVVTNAEAIIEI